MTKLTTLQTQMCAMGVVGQEPIRFSLHHNDDVVSLLSTGRFSFLFVLQGELRCSFTDNYRAKIYDQQMMVVDKNQIRELRCVGDVVILECLVSNKMSLLMLTTSRAFRTPHSEIITLNSTLNEWCCSLFNVLVVDQKRDADFYCTFCREFITELLKYPKIELGSLFVPLYVCSRKCDECE